MIDRNLANSMWVSTKGFIARVDGFKHAYLLDEQGYVGEYAEDEGIPALFGEWMQVATNGRRKDQYLVLVSGRIDDLPLALFDTEEEANRYAQEIWDGGEESVREAVEAGNKAMYRDCSSCVSLRVVKFVDGRATEAGNVISDDEIDYEF